MRALPEWFGFAEPLLGYVEAAKTLPTLIASEAEQDVGFLTVKQHTAGSAEILAMGVLPDRHAAGSDERWSKSRRATWRPKAPASCR
jgi:hypothetical protein